MKRSKRTYLTPDGILYTSVLPEKLRTKVDGEVTKDLNLAFVYMRRTSSSGTLIVFADKDGNKYKMFLKDLLRSIKHLRNGHLVGKFTTTECGGYVGIKLVEPSNKFPIISDLVPTGYNTISFKMTEADGSEELIPFLKINSIC